MSEKLDVVAGRMAEISPEKIQEGTEALQAAVDTIRDEYKDYKLTKQQKDELAAELGVEKKTVDGWQTVSDVLDHIDLVQIAKKHPEAIGKVSKGIARVIGTFVPAVNLAATAPDRAHAKVLEIAGLATPEHLLNVIAKRQVEKKRKKAEAATEEKYVLETAEEPAVVDAVEEIRRYKALADEGIITQDEFEQKKKQLLAL